jgi:hypothetical protein
MVRAELCWPRPNVGALAGGIGAYQRNMISARLTARATRTARLVRHGHAWRFGGPTRSSTDRLSSVLASTYMSAESSDSWSDRSATVAMSNQPRICCPDDSTIRNAAFPTGRDQHASRQMRLRAQRSTQNSSARNIDAQRLDPEGARHRQRAGADRHPPSRNGSFEPKIVRKRQRRSRDLTRRSSRRTPAGSPRAISRRTRTRSTG